MILLFVRHGESTWNVEGRFQGRKDPPLSELGERQAAAVAVRLAARERPAAIVSSPLARARQTAQTIADLCGSSVAFDERLVEISHGSWEGLLRSEIEQRWPDSLRSWRDDPQTVRFPNGESLADVQARLESFIADAVHFHSPLVVVTHDVLVRLAALWAAHDPLTRYANIKSENAGVTEIDLRDGEPTLVRHNDVTHLGELRSDLARQAL